MSDVVMLTVFGEPKPQGSGALIRSASTGRTFKKQGKGFAEWRNAIAQVAFERAEVHGRFDGDPIEVNLVFVFNRPKSMPRWQRAVPWKANGADVDKLARAVLDGLVAGGLLSDDRIVSRLTAEKRFDDDSAQGVDVEVRALDRFDDYRPKRRA